MRAGRTVAAWFAATILVLAALPAAAAGRDRAEAWLDRTQIGTGETVTLHVRAPGGSSAPDWSVLERDFDVSDVAQGFRTTIVNGRADSSMEWTVTLFPKHAGTVQVPALRVGDAETAPLSVQVQTAASAGRGLAGGGAVDQGANAPIFMEAEVSDPSPYMQGKTLLTVRLLSARNVIDGAISEPEVDGAFVERVGEDKTYHKQIGGRTYSVVERQYAVFPQNAGELVIPPVRFEGRVESDRRHARRDPMGSAFGDSFFDDFFNNSLLRGGLFDDVFGGGETVRLRTQPVSLAVRAKPADAAGTWWLPAKRVDLVDEWADQQPTFRVGEQTTRTVTLQAVGLAASQLPDLQLPALDGAKQYVEPATADTAMSGNDTVAVRRQAAVIIPTRAGRLTLPEVRVDWWDVDAEQPRTAVLPARTVEVLPGVGAFKDQSAAAVPAQHGASSATAPAAAGDARAAATASDSGAAAGAPASPNTEPAWLTGWWPASAEAVLALAALVLVVAWVVFVRRLRQQRGPLPPLAGSPAAGGLHGSGSALVGAAAMGGAAAGAASMRTAAGGAAAMTSTDVRGAERALREACDRSDANAAVHAVLALGRARWPEHPPLSLTAFGDRLGSDDLHVALDGLARARYAAGGAGDADQGSAWNGASLWRCYKAAERGGSRPGGDGFSRGDRRPSDPLPALYPTG